MHGANALKAFMRRVTNCQNGLSTQRCLARDLHHSQTVFKDPTAAKTTVVTMPKLSPSMTEGSLLSWAKEIGDQLEPYELLFELETESLTEEAYRVGDFAGQPVQPFADSVAMCLLENIFIWVCPTGKVAMQIESIEDAFLAKQLVVPSDEALPVGTPIALLCELQEDIEQVAKHQLPANLNEYSKSKHAYRFATWQSYLKERKVEPTGSCM